MNIIIVLSMLVVQNIQTVNIYQIVIDLIEHGEMNVNGIIMARSDEKEDL
jgi:hypothetical protein